MKRFTLDEVGAVSGLIDQYATFKKSTMTLRRLRGYVNNLHRHLPDWALENWQALPAHLEREFSGYKRATQRDKCIQIRGFLKFCVIFHGLDPRAPELISVLAAEVPDPEILTFAQCRRVIAHSFSTGLHGRLYVVLCLYLGLRRTEALQTRREDFDLEAGAASIRWRGDERLKTLSSIRTVPICSAAYPTICEAVESFERGRIFPASENWPYSLDIPYKAGSTIMRHTFASALVSGRIRDDGGKLVSVSPRPDYWQVSRILGHADVNTLRYYAGISDGVPSLHPHEFL